MLVLFTDTDTDVTLKEAEEYGVRLISMPYNFDGQEVRPYEDFTEFDEHAFYQKLREGTLPSTSALNEYNYEKYFEPVFEAGNDILYVHFSRAMSATFDSMDKAVEKLEKKYPDRKFYEIDTKGITIGSYNIVMEIMDLYKAGKSAEEILEWAKEEVDRFAVYFFADNLTFFRRSGRVSGLAGVMGNMIGVRPIIHMNSEGQMVNIGKERGRIKAMNALLNYVDSLAEDIYSHRVVIGHADAPELAERMKQMLVEKYSEKLRIEFSVVNPTAGSHCGPDTLGVSFHAKHR